MTTLENGFVENIPLPAWLLPVKKQAKGHVDIKPAIDKAVLDIESSKKIVAQLKPPAEGIYHHGGKDYDKMAVAQIVIEYDTKHGATIINSGLNQKQIVDSTYVVLRRYYKLDKHDKYVAVNTENFVLLK